jgi:hypothetical protein
MFDQDQSPVIMRGTNDDEYYSKENVNKYTHNISSSFGSDA